MTLERVHLGNKLLAEFMGAKVCNTYSDHVLYDYFNSNPDTDDSKDGYPDDWNRYYASTCLKYHLSYDWLMKVWFRFRNLTFTNAFDKHTYDQMKKALEDDLVNKSLSTVWENLVTAVEWYLIEKGCGLA